MKIDVCIPSLEPIPRTFLQLIQEDIDGGVIHVVKISPLTEARKDLIQRVTTPYFAFLDADIKYRAGLIPALFAQLAPNVGAVQGATVPYGLGEKWDQALQTSRGVQVIAKGQHKRFMTSNAVIKTDIVRDWNPMPSYSGCEDWDLTNHIVNQGYIVKILPLAVQHLRTWKTVRSNSQWFAKAYISLFGKKQAVKYMLKLGIVLLRDLGTLPLHVRRSLYGMYQNSYLLRGFLLNLI